MRLTFAGTQASAPRRSGLLILMRRALDMVVVGVMVVALAKTLSFLGALLG